MSKKFFEPTPEMNQLLSRAGSLQREESLAATSELAKALELPLRQGILDGDILGGIYEAVDVSESTTTEFPLDFLAPGTEKDFRMPVQSELLKPKILIGLRRFF